MAYSVFWTLLSVSIGICHSQIGPPSAAPGDGRATVDSVDVVPKGNHVLVTANYTTTPGAKGTKVIWTDAIGRAILAEHNTTNGTYGRNYTSVRVDPKAVPYVMGEIGVMRSVMVWTTVHVIIPDGGTGGLEEPFVIVEPPGSGLGAPYSTQTTDTESSGDLESLLNKMWTDKVTSSSSETDTSLPEEENIPLETDTTLPEEEDLPTIDIPLPEEEVETTGIDTPIPEEEEEDETTGIETPLPEEEDETTGIETPLPEEEDETTGIETPLPEEEDETTGIDTPFPEEKDKTTEIDTPLPEGEITDCVSTDELKGVTADTLTFIPQGDLLMVVANFSKTCDASHTIVIWRSVTQHIKLGEYDGADAYPGKDTGFTSVEVDPSKVEIVELYLGVVKRNSGALFWAAVDIPIKEKKPITEKITETLVPPVAKMKPTGPLEYKKGKDAKLKITIPTDEKVFYGYVTTKGKSNLKYMSKKSQKKYTKLKTKKKGEKEKHKLKVRTSKKKMYGFVDMIIEKDAKDKTSSLYMVEIQKMLLRKGKTAFFPTDYIGIVDISDYGCTTDHYCDVGCTAYGNNLHTLTMSLINPGKDDLLLASATAEEMSSNVLLVVPQELVAYKGTSKLEVKCEAKTSTGKVKTLKKELEVREV